MRPRIGACVGLFGVIARKRAKDLLAFGSVDLPEIQVKVVYHITNKH